MTISTKLWKVARRLTVDRRFNILVAGWQHDDSLDMSVKRVTSVGVVCRHGFNNPSLCCS
jgi:hypothetical protein